jgi:hypothetical protein
MADRIAIRKLRRDLERTIAIGLPSILIGCAAGKSPNPPPE